MKTDRLHFERRQLERFLDGETSHAENRAVVRHLLRSCTESQTEPLRVRPVPPEQAISNRS